MDVRAFHVVGIGMEIANDVTRFVCFDVFLLDDSRVGFIGKHRHGIWTYTPSDVELLNAQIQLITFPVVDSILYQGVGTSGLGDDILILAVDEAQKRPIRVQS